ncbi:MAG: EAL domain-containing protein, partial [Sphingomonas sp.]
MVAAALTITNRYLKASFNIAVITERAMQDAVPYEASARTNSHRVETRLPTLADVPFRGPSLTGEHRVRPAGKPSRTSSARAWQFVCLVEIGNFLALRRYLGIARADRLVLDVHDRLAESIPHARLKVVSRTQVELSADGDDDADLAALVSVVVGTFDESLDLESERHRVEVIIGAVASPRGLAEDVRVIEEAEHALEQARIDRQPVIRDLTVGAPAFDRRTLARELNPAIVQGQMFLQYQPKIHVRRQEIASAEALVRWQHPVRGLILPGDFITIAEEAREICALTLWTIDQVIADQKVLAADGYPLTVFIN